MSPSFESTPCAAATTSVSPWPPVCASSPATGASLRGATSIVMVAKVLVSGPSATKPEGSSGQPQSSSSSPASVTANVKVSVPAKFASGVYVKLPSAFSTSTPWSGPVPRE